MILSLLEVSIQMMPQILFESNEETLGFSLRLGQNLDYCYSLSKEQSVPTHAVDGEIMLWNWTSAESDWNYPLEVSSSIYKMSTILSYSR